MISSLHYCSLFENELLEKISIISITSLATFDLTAYGVSNCKVCDRKVPRAKNITKQFSKKESGI